MNNKSGLKSRGLYPNKIISFQDMEPIKVITGIRRYKNIKSYRLAA